jgi:hypothetical protein
VLEISKISSEFHVECWKERAEYIGINPFLGVSELEES